MVRETRKSKRGEARPRRGREAEDLAHKILDIRRVTRVVRGGRRFSFSVVLVAGDRQGKVGIGVGKSGDISQAIEKGLGSARKSLFTVPRTKEGSLPHEVAAKFGASRVVLRPAPGRGLVAGSAVRAIMDLAGVRDVSAKIHSRSKNRLNNARATMVALRALTSATPAVKK